MNEHQLLSKLQSLEIELHQPGCRTNAERLDALLHDSFFEIGSSGRKWSKKDILEELPKENPNHIIISQDYAVEEIAEKTALLTYLSANKHETGELSRYCARTSLWQYTLQGWKMRFHQGTATSAFSENTT